jgi:hypothetical protein
VNMVNDGLLTANHIMRQLYVSITITVIFWYLDFAAIS